MRWQEELRQLAPGASMVRLTDGRYGRLHVLRELLDMAGPGADVLAVTWCIGPIELATLAQMVRRGTTTVRLLVDAEQFRATLGRGRAPRDIRVDVRCSKVHAKIDLVRSPRGAWAICGSMNLNPNRRLEQWVALAGLGAERLSADLERVWDVAMSPARAQGAPAAFWRVGARLFGECVVDAPVEVLPSELLADPPHAGAVGEAVRDAYVERGRASYGSMARHSMGDRELGDELRAAYTGPSTRDRHRSALAAHSETPCLTSSSSTAHGPSSSTT